jgi:plasmid stabilization system protein ParE
VPEWDDDAIRDVTVHSYRMIYRVRPGTIEILAVIHGARVLPDEIRERHES